MRAPMRLTSLHIEQPWQLPALLLLIGFLLGRSHTYAQVQERRPTIEAGIDAWLLTRTSVNDLHVPPRDQLQPERLGPDVEGASLVIRFGGRIIGVGDSYSKGSDTLRQAIATAVRDARTSQRVRDLPFEMMESVGKNSTIELELAGIPTPLLGDTLEETASQIRPGIDGMAIRRGDRWRWAFPARMQAFGQAERPDRVLIRLLRELGLPPREPSELRRIDDVEFYRFEVLCLSQATPTGPPYEALRGAKIVSEQIPIQTLANAVASDAAMNIEARLAVDPERPVGEVPGSDRLSALGLFGDYNFARDNFDPLVGAPSDQALAAWALAKYAQANKQLSKDQRERLIQLNTLTLDRLAIVDEVEDPPFDDPKTAALIVLADLANTQAQKTAQLPIQKSTIFDEAKTQLLSQIEKETQTDGANLGTVLALRYLAATRLNEATPGTVPNATLQQLQDAAWRQPTGENLIGSLHFLLLAESSAAPDDTATARQEAMRLALNGALSNQIAHPKSLTATNDPVGDLTGGFVLANAPRVTATSSSLRPALALAIALNLETSDALPEDQRAAWKTGRTLGLRFARQLQVHAGALARCPSPERAQGGLKSAPWSNKCRLADTALALLLASEVLESPAG